MTLSYGQTDRQQEAPIRRFFTPSQANEALVLVRKIVADITDGYGRIGDLQEAMEAARQAGRYDRADQISRQTLDVMESLQGCAQELDDVGAELEDWVLGIVGFPCIAGAREVVLCWQEGDPEVAYWHEVNSGCSARKPVSTLPVEQAISAGQP